MQSELSPILQENQGGQAPALPPIPEGKAGGRAPAGAEAQAQGQSCLDALWRLLSQAAALYRSCPAAIAQALKLLLTLCQVPSPLQVNWRCVPPSHCQNQTCAALKP